MRTWKPVWRACAPVLLAFVAAFSSAAWGVAYRAEVINPDFQHAARNPATGTLVVVGSDSVVWRQPAGDAQWHATEASLGGATLNRVAFGDGVAVAVGEDGLLLRSEDDGAHWVNVGENVDVPPGLSLRDVLPLGNGTWLAAGSAGQVLRSSDGGRRWTPHGIGTALQITRLLAGPGGAVWAVGEGALIAHSADAGQQWRIQHHQEGAPPLRSIALARGVLLAGGGLGLVLRSTNGGATWAAQRTPSSAFVEVLQPVPRHGTWVALTHQGERLWSRDGGRRWHAAGPALGTALSALWQDPASGRLVAVGHGGAVQRSSDGGRRWVRQDLGAWRDLLGVLAHAQGLAAWGRHGLLLQADASGRSWQVQREALQSDTTTLAALPDGRTVVAAGTAGWMARSIDAGAQWLPVPMRFVVETYPTDFRALRVVDGGSGLLAAGPTASVMRSDDGGAQWRSVLHKPFESAETPVDLVAARDGTWIVPEMSGPIDTSRDAGRSWQRQAAPAAWPADSITRTGLASAHDGTVLLVGRGTQLLRSQDPARHWQPVALPGAFNLFALWADAHGPRWWLAGADGALLRSDDAGLSWRTQVIETTPPVRSVLLALARTRSGHMVTAGRDGVMAVSDDGERWTRLSTATTQDLRIALHEPGTGRLVLVGRGGMVLRCIDDACTQTEQIPSHTRSDFRAAIFLSDGTLVAAGTRIVRLVPR